MTNDTNTLNGALSELGETLADNLVSMGVVDATASDGLTTLAGKILNIEPSIGGLDLDTSVSLTSSGASITVGESVVLTSKLTASYDDETLVNVDLSGVLTGATIEFYNGNSVVGSAVTDSTGVATYTFTPVSAGTYSLKAVFAGTDNFDSCESSVVPIVVNSYTLALTGDNSVIMTGGTCTLTATLLDGGVAVSGETVSFYKGATLLGTDTTDSSGIATYTYTGLGSGDVSFKAEYSSIQSEIFVLEDCVDVITADTDQSNKFGSSISLRNNGSATLSYDSTNKYYKFTNNVNNSESFIPLNNATGLNDFIIEFDAMTDNTNGILGLDTYHNSTNWLRLSNLSNKKSYYYNNNGSASENEENSSAVGTNRWVHFKFIITNSTITKEIYYNDTLQETVSQSVSSTWFDSSTKYGIPVLWGTGWSNHSFLKNFKIKPL